MSLNVPVPVPLFELYEYERGRMGADSYVSCVCVLQTLTTIQTRKLLQLIGTVGPGTCLLYLGLVPQVSPTTHMARPLVGNSATGMHNSA